MILPRKITDYDVHSRAVIGGKAVGLLTFINFGLAGNIELQVPTTFVLDTVEIARLFALPGAWHGPASNQEFQVKSHRDDLAGGLSHPLQPCDTSSYQDQIEELWQNLRDLCPIAVRSSSPHEDGAYSFAGLHKSVLSITSAGELGVAITNVVRSGFMPAANAYKKSTGQIYGETRMMPVIIQPTIVPAFSGSLQKWGSEQNSKVVIEAVSGLSDRMMNGQVTPYSIVIAYSEADRPALTDIKIDSIYAVEHMPSFLIASLFEVGVELGKRVPHDFEIEWAIDEGNRFWILQYRALRSQKIS
ncbi:MULTISPECIES: phosphoenolpyruvate synthase [Rhizobium/Agrobacterium group]|uniref:Phosphoenolpyruvate synthase n=1 Tax=Agrobacterium tumefaciens TaxID=358 RepID=Q676G4_AGRTU|nr:MULTISPECIES: phosphoenolpyruvate synthase [Agrobacterium tumefaciens complex]AAS02145.1 probable phosphoenolpyruvate synthase [Agrobacterium radiobacter]UXS56413.1 hypothetical protein FY148_27395 [Agrobacterium tumefaciens]UXS66757.1 hypothetical protein FY147_28130 [Agrobacterium tumefaciens]UXT85497.1 hypothetical protein FY131_28950 [Agrobacterium tumefaciens]